MSKIILNVVSLFFALQLLAQTTELIYPEFKGYHDNLYWAKLETTESPFTIISAMPNLYFQLFKPGKPKFVIGGVSPDFPEGDISFLLDIPAIGTKFKKAEQLGPKSQNGIYEGHDGDDGNAIKLWFDFRSPDTKFINE